MTPLIDKLPVATLSHYVGIALAVVGVINKDLTWLQALLGAGGFSLGSAAIGHVRNGAGRGLKR